MSNQDIILIIISYFGIGAMFCFLGGALLKDFKSEKEGVLMLLFWFVGLFGVFFIVIAQIFTELGKLVRKLLSKN